jgi:hypothetical protein
LLVALRICGSGKDRQGNEGRGGKSFKQFHSHDPFMVRQGRRQHLPKPFNVSL